MTSLGFPPISQYLLKLYKYSEAVGDRGVRKGETRRQEKNYTRLEK